MWCLRPSFQLETKGTQQIFCGLATISGNRDFKSPITYFTISERVMGLFFLSFTSSNCTNSAPVRSIRREGLRPATFRGEGGLHSPPLPHGARSSLGLSCSRGLGASSCEAVRVSPS